MRQPVLLVAATAVALLGGCGAPPTGPPPPSPAGTPVPTVAGPAPAALTLGPAAQGDAGGVDGAAALTLGGAAADTAGGALPGDTMLDPTQVTTPILSWLDPALLDAVQRAARRAAQDGIDMKVTSGWRSRGFQQRLLDDGVRTYGGLDAARQFVATPEVSKHVVGQAVDIGPTPAAEWMIANGRQFGLCQIFANENWHFELAVDANGDCPPLRPNAAG